MTKTSKLYEQLEKRFVKWARYRSDIRAAVVVGSQARLDHPADEWADLDIMVVTTDPQHYISTTDWIEKIGNPILTYLEAPLGEDDMERRVLFEGMLDVDFAIIPYKNVQQLFQNVQQLLKDKISPNNLEFELQLFNRGIRVLLDKDKMITQLQKQISSIETSHTYQPTESEFLEVVSDFLHHAVWTAKHLQRGELWWTVTCLDCHMQRLILRMIEWHAFALHGSSYDTWFRGRFLEEWAHPRALKGLQSVFAHYNKDDIKHALLEAIAMFGWMAVEIAEKLSYAYPAKAEKQVIEWIRKCFSERSVEQ